MQKLILTVSVLLIMFFPVFQQQAGAMQPVSDEEMNMVTGMAGISMSFDDLCITIEIPRFTYTDIDGENYSDLEPLAGQALAATMRLANINLDSLTLNSIYRTGADDLPDHYIQSNPSKWINDSHIAEFRALTIDAAADLSPAFWGNRGVAAAGLCIGLPTMDAYIDTFVIDGFYIDRVETRPIGIWDTLLGVKEWFYSDHERDFFKLQVHGASITTLGGKIGFLSYDGCGADIAMDDVQLYAKIDEIRIIDSDGVFNPVDDIYNNRPQIGGTDDGPIAGWIVLKDIEIDTLRINSLAFSEMPANDETPVSLFSPGTMGAYLNYSSCMNNYRRSDMGFFQSAGRLYNPLTIDITTGLPITTALHRASGGNGSILGIHIGMPTSELHVSEMTVGGIHCMDANGGNYENIGYVVYNHDTSLIKVQVKDSVTTTLSGSFEVSAH
ncbi:MAG: hypothetical protein WAR22_13595 [Desulfomonilia bacterium]